MKTQVAFVVLMLLLAATATTSKGQSCNKDCSRSVKNLLEQERFGYSASWLEKANSRLGDSAAIGIQQIFKKSELYEPRNVRLYLPIIRRAFENERLITGSANRTPTASLRLLQKLKTRVQEPSLLREIEQTIDLLKNLQR